MKLISLVLFAVVAACVVTTAKANDCLSPAKLTEQLKAHPSIVAVKALNAQETALTIDMVVSNGPDPSNAVEGLLALREDHAIGFAAWMKDGSCGFAIVPPHAVQPLMQALARFSA